MVVRNTLFSAMCVAGLLGVASVAPAAAAGNNLIIDSVTVAGTTVTVTGDIQVQSGQKITSGIFEIGSLGLSGGMFYNAIGLTTGVSNVVLAKYTLDSSPAGALLGFKTNGPFFANSASASFSVDVPEPNTVAFGVIAAGSVAGLVLRKRRKMA